MLAGALGPGPGALAVGAPPVVGRLVRELRARGATLPEPICARCGRAHLKLAVRQAGLCPPVPARHNAAACGRCGVVKVATAAARRGSAVLGLCPSAGTALLAAAGGCGHRPARP